MRVLAETVPPRLAATALTLYGTVGVGAAVALMTLISGSLYAQFGAQGFWVMAALCAAAVAPAPAFAQHNHHHMMMKHGAAKLETHDDPAAQLLTVRLGPLNLPAHSDHMAVTQPGTPFFATPFDGWLLDYHPRLTDDEATIAVDHFDPVLRDGLTTFFSRALRRDPAERFGNAEEMLRAWRETRRCRSAHM